MSLLILAGLLAVLSGLLVARLLRRGVGVLAGIGAALCALALLAGVRPTALPLPIGLVGGGGALQLDGLSAAFLLLTFLVAALADAEPLCVAAAGLTMLAGDLVLLAVAGTLTLLALPRPGFGLRMDRVRVLAAGGLVGASALLSGLAAQTGALLPDTGFSLTRAGLAGGLGRTDAAVLLPLLVALGIAPLLGLWPFAAWHRRLCGSGPGWAVAVVSLVGLFLPLRLLLDLGGSAPPAGWGYALGALGLVSALRAAAAALREPTLRGAVARLLAVQNGLAVFGAALCLLARACDLPMLAAASLDAVLLLLPAQALAGLAMLTLATAMEAEAGASLLARLGGLIQSMPRATALAAIAVATLAFLPPAGGFPALWLLLQAVLVLARGSAPAVAALALSAAMAVVIAAGLSGLGWLRLAAVAALGRPRTPRGAAAREMAPRQGRAVVGLLALPVAVGLLPGMWLRLLQPVGAGLAVGLDADPPPLLHLAAPGDTATLSPLPLAALLLAAITGCLLAGRRISVRPERRAPAWEGGAAPPPPWLPFGDPLTQIGPATLRQVVGRQLAGEVGGWSALSARPAWCSSPGRRRRTALRLAGTGSAALLTLLRRQGAALALLAFAALIGLCLAWRGA